jgi:hypothetical protein
LRSVDDFGASRVDTIRSVRPRRVLFSDAIDRKVPGKKQVIAPSIWKKNKSNVFEMIFSANRVVDWRSIFFL